MKKHTKILQWLDTGIFPATILFAHGFEYDELMKELLKIPAKDWCWHAGLKEDKSLIDNGTCFALKRELEHVNGGQDTICFYIILKEQFKFSDYDYCKLAHEVLHICQFMLKDFLDRDREFECEAYLHTHIMKQCLQHLRGNNC